MKINSKHELYKGYGEKTFEKFNQEIRGGDEITISKNKKPINHCNGFVKMNYVTGEKTKSNGSDVFQKLESHHGLDKGGVENIFECTGCYTETQIPTFINVSLKLYCSGCKSKLIYCKYCSSKQKKLYTVSGSLEQRCPNCSNTLFENTPCNHAPIEIGLRRAAFCRAIFTCRASYNLWATASEFDLEDCQACKEPVSKLKDRDLLAEQVSSCPFCLSIFGIPNFEEEFEFFNGSQDLVVNKLKTKVVIDTGDTFRFKLFDKCSEYCEVCGSHTLLVLSWMYETGYAKSLFIDGSVENLRSENRKHLLGENYSVKIGVLDEIDYSDAIVLYKMLMKNFKDDKVKMDVINYIVEKIGKYDLNKIRSLKCIFKKNSIQEKSLNKKLCEL